MRFTIMTLIAAFAIISAAPAFAGDCDHSWQTAKDGSACGGRSADSREGGR